MKDIAKIQEAFETLEELYGENATKMITFLRNFTTTQGEKVSPFIFIEGKQGSGKTTFLNCFSRIYESIWIGKYASKAHINNFLDFINHLVIVDDFIISNSTISIEDLKDITRNPHCSPLILTAEYLPTDKEYYRNVIVIDMADNKPFDTQLYSCFYRLTAE